MLLREKLGLTGLLAFVVLSFIDILTPLGNQFWEKTLGFSGRYSILQGDKVGYVNGRCRLIIPPRYDQGTNYFTETIAPVKSANRWGYIDVNGRWVIPPKFIWAGDLSEGRAPVLVASNQRGGQLKYGFIDDKGVMIVPPIYAKVQPFSQGAAAVMSTGRWQFIRYNGQPHNALSFEDVKSFSAGLAAAKENGRWGFVDRSGIFIIRPQFDDVKPFAEGLAAAKINGKWGYLNRTGQWALKPQWSQANSFSNGLAIADGHYIDATGAIKINGGRFGEITDFSEGFAAVEVPAKYKFQNSKWGYIDQTGQFFIEPRFELTRSFKGGLARVSKDKNGLQRGYVFTNGALVWDPADWEKSAVFHRNVKIARTIFIFVLCLIVYKFLRYRYQKLYSIRTIS